MYVNLHASLEVADWSDDAPQRLLISLLVATLIVTGALSFFRSPVFSDLPPIAELIVEIIRNEPQEILERAEPSQPEPAPTRSGPPDESIPAAEEPPVEAPTPAVDWMGLIGGVAKNIIDNPPKVYSVNPEFDEKRRLAREQYRPSEAPVRKEIWENTEKDQLGRTILRNGNCYRVLDDPNLWSRYVFEQFDQYMVYCSYYKRKPRELPWAREMRERADRSVN